MKLLLGLLFSMFAVVSVSELSSAQSLPACLNDSGQPLALSDSDVLQMKTSTPNSFRARALISGAVTKIYPDHSCHHHFQLKIGAGPNDTIEVIYNEEFGSFPAFGVGANVVACGDYITSNRQTQYPASPDGAIIHWVHKSPNLARHQTGYLMINGAMTGQSIGANSQCN